MITRSYLARLWDSARIWRHATGAFATLSLAFLVAAAVSRGPPDYSGMPVIAVLRDGEQRPIWAIRLARAAHQIAADSLRSETAPAGHVYLLWLSVPDAMAPRRLGVLPQSGRKRIAVSPRNARLLTGAGELLVTIEPPGGPPGPTPSGPTVFRAILDNSG
jgi:anti-sigma-K factor RskA